MGVLSLRPEFDGTQEFKALRPVKASGVRFEVGETFDKSLVSPRVLRQLYDHKMLIMGTGLKPSKPLTRAQRKRKETPTHAGAA
jgi:hypothetical protein